jgi:hypothetical protein
MSDRIDNLMTQTIVDPNIAQTNNQVNIQSVNIYEFMDHSLNGTGGYRDGSYLIPHDREMNYDSRRSMAYYRNFVRPILRAMIEPVFTEEALRVIKDENGNVLEDSLLNGFTEDCTNTGTEIQEMSQEVLEYTRLHGVTFVVMDNFSDQPKTEAEAIENRIYPYIYIKTANQVKKDNGYQVDMFGKLEWICFTEKKNEKGEQLYRKWDKTQSVIIDEKGEAVEQPKLHNLGVVPVISIYAAKRKCLDEILVDPPLYDLAKINFTIFNKDSEIRDQERAQGFSIFYLQSDSPGNITLGNKNVLYLPIGSTIQPGFASPDWQILKGLQESGEKLREDLFRMAEQSGVTGVQSGSSGIALEWDFFAHESVLKKTSSLAEAFEEAVAELFNLYTKKSYIYEVEYPEDFAPNNKTKELDLYDKSLLMDLPPLAKAKIKEKVARLLFYDIEEEEMKAIIDEIKLEAEDAQLSGATDEGDEGATGIQGATGINMQGATGMMMEE